MQYGTQLLLTKVAATPVTGFALQTSATPIISWTAPNDGNLHRVAVFGTMHVTSTETGGQVTVAYTLPDGTAVSHTLFAANLSAGDDTPAQAYLLPVETGATVSVTQLTALTGGAALMWAELWGS